MAGFYAKDDYDLAGFGVGIVDRDKIITGETIGRRRPHRPAVDRRPLQRLLLGPQDRLERQQMKLDQYVDELGMTIGGARDTDPPLSASVPADHKTLP